MPDAPALFPELHFEATSYEAAAGRVVEPAVAPTPPPVPSPAAVKASSASRPAASSKLRRILPWQPVRNDVLEEVEHAGGLELFSGPYDKSSWGLSALVHALMLTALAFLIMSPQASKPQGTVISLNEPLSSGEGDGDGAGVGEAIGDLDAAVSSSIRIDGPVDLGAIGGSTGNSQIDTTSVFGGTAGGLGRGSGGGIGDGIGNEIMGRVQAAGGKGGKLQISVAWNDRNDLDLHLVTPGGERIFYAKTTSSDGGELDVDMNVNGESTKPVENITWGGKTPADGKYLIQVHFFARHATPRSQFNVRLELGGSVQLLSGTAESGRFTQVASFDVKNGRAVAVDTQLQEKDEAEVAVNAGDAKRLDAREKAAKEALIEADATADATLKAGKYRAIIRRFEGTPSAATAKQKLDALPAS